MTSLSELLVRYGLSNWDVTVRYSSESTDGSLGETHLQSDWKEATINIYTEDIAEHARRFPNETIPRTLEHEVCEIAVAEDCAMLPEHITEHPDFMRFRDCMAERLRRCVTRAHVKV